MFGIVSGIIAGAVDRIVAVIIAIFVLLGAKEAKDKKNKAGEG